MPTYEYACRSCGEHQEVVQSFRDDPLTTCPACGGPLRKVFGSIGVVFKGSGFYKNDSRPAAKDSSSSKETKATTTSESTGSSKEGTGSSKDKKPSSEGSSSSSADKSPKSSSPSTPASGARSSKAEAAS